VTTPHSVVTAHLIDEAGQPTIAARDEILSFLRAQAQIMSAACPKRRAPAMVSK